MGVTICADGLSIVHKGSGGEANATLPDVCLTTVGNAVDPLPYGNAAKSADLADGSETVTADGGNSIAIKGCSFTKSTGDSGGDKKGAASGTIEGEAKFISCSPTVKIEGKGVCRLSDQLTMNKANTMCMGGINQASVSVSPDEDGTYTLDISCSYPDGEPLVNAKYKITDIGGGVLKEGTLDDKGKGVAPGLPGGACRIEYGEDSRSYKLINPNIQNKHFNSNLIDKDFFYIVAKGKPTFWDNTRISRAGSRWGIIGNSLEKSPDFYDLVETVIRYHFTLSISDVDCKSLAQTLISLIGEKSESDPLAIKNIIILAAPCIIELGSIVSLLAQLPETETNYALIARLRRFGRGDPQQFLDNFDWSGIKNSISDGIDKLIGALVSRLMFMKDQASIKHLTAMVDMLKKHIDKLKAVKKGLIDGLADYFVTIEDKVNKIRGEGSEATVAKTYTMGYSTLAGSITNFVNWSDKPIGEIYWVKIRAMYDDLWETPLAAANVSVFADGNEHTKGIELNAGNGISTDSDTKDIAEQTKQEPGVAIVTDLPVNTDLVTIELGAEPGLEKEIINQQNTIESILDGAYQATLKDMTGFQEEWEIEGMSTLATSLGSGSIAGAELWADGLADLVDPDTWIDMGNLIADVSSDVVDTLAIHAADKFNGIIDYYEDAEGNLANWTWISSQLNGALSSVEDSINETMDDFSDLVDSIEGGIETVVLMLKYRNEIQQLPLYIAEANINEIERFIDTVLFEIDPKIAMEIKENENYPFVIEIIRDHNTALTFLAYFQLISEAVPPNFYSYVSGKYGTYLLLEVTLTVLLAFFSGGAAAAGRIAMITARLASASSKVNNIRKVNNAMTAIDSFQKTLNNFIQATEKMESLGKTLVKARNQGVKVVGSGRKTLILKKQNIMRNKGCRMCGSDKHKSPRNLRGCVVYK